MMDNPSADLVARWREGDEQAAQVLFQRYAERLLALARSRLSAKLARHLDPEDVVQSACRSFFIGARNGRYVLQRSGDLWRLLVAITLHKLQHQIERLSAGKRAVDRERHPESGPTGLAAQAVAREPTPAEAAALADTLELLLHGLDAVPCLMVQMRLEGYTIDEIAAAVRRSERTVRRILDGVKQRLEQEFFDQPRP
jgi:RNA polymerase sigma-70 factor (ECF subfamily)